MTLLKVSAISKQDERGPVLKGISFSQRRFQKIAIAGETGSGKSTLLKIIAGLIQQDAGDVWFENEAVKGPAERLVPGHPRISYLSQHFELPKFLRVEQVLSYANTLSEDEAGTLYRVCQINHLLTRKTDQLSGGEKQRIAMAKLLIASPRLLLLDEPFSNLDMIHKNTLKSIIHDISEKLKISCILISHDALDTLPWADEILVMRAGQIIQHGPPEQIYRHPVNEYTAGLFGNYNLISHESSSAFSEALGIKNNGKKLFIRPEHFKITREGNHGLMGKVNRVNFFGSYYEIEVSLPENIITVKTEDAGFSRGDTIRVYLHK